VRGNVPADRQRRAAAEGRPRAASARHESLLSHHTRRSRLLRICAFGTPARGLSKGTPPRAWSSRCAPAPAAYASPRSAGSRCATGAANFLSECQAPGDFARRDGANRFATHLATITLNILFRGRAAGG